jgi:hypothetical protein
MGFSFLGLLRGEVSGELESLSTTMPTWYLRLESYSLVERSVFLVNRLELRLPNLRSARVLTKKPRDMI